MVHGAVPIWRPSKYAGKTGTTIGDLNVNSRVCPGPAKSTRFHAFCAVSDGML